MKKRNLIALLMAVCMMFSLLPVNAIAVGAEDAASAAPAEETLLSENGNVSNAPKQETPAKDGEGDKAAAPAEGEKTEDGKAAAPVEGEKAEDGKAPAEGEKTPSAEKPAEGEKAEDGKAPAEGKKTPGAEKSAEGEKAEDGKAPAEGEKTPGAEKSAEEEKAEDEAAADEQHAEDGENGIALTMVLPDEGAYLTYIFKVPTDSGWKTVAEQIVKDGETLLRPASPEKDGYKFTGWNTAENGTGDPISFGTVSVAATADVTAYAQFTPVLYLFFADPNGRIVLMQEYTELPATVSTVGVTYGLESTDAAVTGWYYDNVTYAESANTVTLTDKNVTVYAKVEKGNWVNYDSNGGSYIAPAFYPASAATIAPPDPTKPGYTFNGWIDENGAAFAFGGVLEESVALTAQWEAESSTTYTINYWIENPDDTGYSYYTSAKATGKTGDPVSVAGYTGTSWLTNSITTDKDLKNAIYYNQEKTEEELREKTIAGDGTTVVNVYFKRQVYTITFHLDEPTYSCGKEEHTHDIWCGWGWNCSKEEHTHSSACGGVSELTITAKYGASIGDQWPTVNGSSAWRTTKYSSGRITYQSNIDTMPLNGADFYGPKTGSGSVTAYYYVEILPDESGTTTYGDKSYKLHHSDTTPGSNVSVTKEDQYPIRGFTFTGGTRIGENYNNAKFYYKRNSYTIEYRSEGAPVNTVSKLFDQSVSDAGNYTPAKPEGKENFTFGGWYDDPACTTPHDFTGKMPAYNMVVYAKWNAPTFKNTAFLSVSGTGGNETLEVEYGKTIEDQLKELEKSVIYPDGQGWKFVGWVTKDANGNSVPFNPGTKIYRAYELYPSFTNTYESTVTYVEGENKAYTDSKIYMPGTQADVQKPRYDAPTGKVFLGWATEEDSTDVAYQPNDKLTVPAAGATLYAVYGDKDKTVELTYDPNGGTGTPTTIPSLLNNGRVKVASPDDFGFSREGYEFLGWNTKADGTGTSFEAGEYARVNRKDSNVLYAQWKQTSANYTVEYYYEQSDNTFAKEASRPDQVRTGTTGAKVSVTDDDKKPNSEAYVFDAGNDENVLSGTIAANGSLVLKVYFKLNTAKYTIHHYLAGTTTQVAPDETGSKTIGASLSKADSKGAAFYPAFDGKLTIKEFDIEKSIVKDETENVIRIWYWTTLTLTAGSDSKMYDGNPLTCDTFTAKGLINGDTQDDFSVAMTDASTITDAGSTSNNIDELKIVYKNGTVNAGKVPSYYNVVLQPGTLTVTQSDKEITVTVAGNTNTVTYNGEEQSVTDFEVTNNPANAKVTLNADKTAIAKGTDAGKYMMGLKAADFTATSKNYSNIKIAYTDGWLKINPTSEIDENITLNTTNVVNVYDGKTYTAGTASATDKNGGEVTIEYSADDGKTWTTDPTTITAKNVSESKTVQVRASGANYTGYVTGTQALTITKRTVILTSDTATKPYDGTALTRPTVAVSGDGFVTGEVSGITATGSVTYVTDGPNKDGVVENTIEYTENDSFVEGNYTITVRPGTLTITKRTDVIVITTPTRTRAYNGNLLWDGACDYTGTLAEGDELIITFATDHGQRDVGSMPNQFESYRVENKATGANVTANYNFGAHQIGTLTVTPVAIELTAYTAHKTYDGKALTSAGYQITKGKFVGEEGLADVTVTGSRTDVGDSANKITAYKLKDNTLAENYSITCVDGELTVWAKALKITAGSRSKPYDGTPLTENTYSSTELAEGDTIYSVTVTGSQTEAGFSDNVASDAVIKNAKGEIVTGNYKITYAEGKLEVTKSSEISSNITLTTEDVVKPYDGKTYNAGTAEATDSKGGAVKIEYSADGGKTWTDNPGTITAKNVSDSKTIQVRASGANYSGYVTGTQTLKITPVKIELTAYTAHKTYDGKALTSAGYQITKGKFVGEEGLADVTVTGSRTDVGDSANKITAYKLKDNTLAENYSITCVDGELTVWAKALKITAGSRSKPYDGTPLTENTYSSTELAEGDTIYSVTVTGSQTEAGFSDNVASDAVIKNAKGEIVTGNYKITYAEGKLEVTKSSEISSNITLTTEDVVKPYDGKTYNAGTAEATDSKGGAVKIEYSADGGKTWTDNPGTITAKNVSDSKTIQVRASGANYSGYVTGTQTLKITPVKIELTAYTANKTYDGKALTSAGYQITKGKFVGEEGLADVTVTGSRTDVGDSANKITAYKLKDNTLAENYSITCVDGELTVWAKALKITAGSRSKPYDGTPLTENTYSSTELAEGDTIYSVTVTGSQTEAGFSDNVASDAVIKNANDEIVTGNYDITYVKGTLTVTQDATEIIVKVKGKTDTVTYNGGEQFVTDFEVTSNPVNATVTLNAGKTAIAKGTNVGTHYMGLTAADFTAMSKNYSNIKIEYTDGSLEITKAALTITAESASKTYNGTPLTKNSFSSTGLVGEDKIESVTVTGSQTEAGFSNNVASDAVIKNASGKNVTGNYDITYKPGTLTVTKAAEATVTITGKTLTVTYNGEEQSVTDFVVTNNPANATVTLNEGKEAKASGTDAGKYMMGLTAADFTATSPNYETVTVKYTDGWLKIDPITTETTVYVYGNTDYRYYNRNIQTVEGFEVGYGTDPTISVKLADGKKAIAAGRTVKTYMMGLTEKHFVATSPNYTNIKLVVEDGWLAILPNPDEIVVTIRGNSDTVTYDGKEHTVTGYTVEVEDEVFAIELRTKGKDTAKGTEPGTYNMGLTAADFRVESKNYSNVKVIVEDGALKIEPVTGPTPTPDPTEPTPTPELEDIEEPDTPTTGYTSAWALVNLICAILTVIFSVVLLIGLAGKKTKTEEAENGEEVEKEIKKKKFWRFFSIVPALAAVIVFLLTEDMRLPMVFVDRWTLLMVIIGLVQVLVMVFAKKTKKDPDEEEEAKA